MNDFIDSDDIAMMDDLLSKKDRKKEKKHKNKEKTNNHVVVASVPKERPLEDPCDYDYEMLLNRIQDLMGTNVQSNIVIKAPQVSKVGAKKTALTNYHEICSHLNRTAEHVKNYIMSELGTEGSVDASNRLLIKGKFTQKQLESVFKKYVLTYVQCQMCKSLETTLARDPCSRLFFVTCIACKSSKSVTNINSGFRAITKNDRKIARATE